MSLSKNDKEDLEAFVATLHTKNCSWNSMKPTAAAGSHTGSQDATKSCRESVMQTIHSPARDRRTLNPKPKP